MKKTTLKFQDGDILFREGQASDTVYSLVTGTVELSKACRGGAVRLAIIAPGEFFGEMGVIDSGPRTATAQAKGEVSVEVISRDEFLSALKTRPNLAMAVMAKMARRLRTADEQLAKPSKIRKIKRPQAGPSKPGYFRRLIGGDRKKLPKPKPLEICIAPLEGEEGPGQTKLIVAALEKRKGIKIRSTKSGPPDLEHEETPNEMRAATANARNWLLAHNADLLVWGDIPSPGATLRLHFISAVEDLADMPGSFSLSNILYLPINFGPELADLLAMVTLAALTPRDAGKSLFHQAAMLTALESALPKSRALPTDLTSHEQAVIKLCFGSALALFAHLRGATELYQVAAQHLNGALETLREDNHRTEWAMAQRQLGAVLLILGDQTDDPEVLEKAVDALRAGLRVLNKNDFPVEWASSQHRLGQALYKIYLTNHDPELIKWALAAHQDALQVFTRTGRPDLWAEIMNNFALAAQELGSLMKNEEVLRKAAEACRVTLEIRSQEKTPLLWAATQNNLGTALFLLGDLSKNQEYFAAALEAFEAAHDVYAAQGSAQMAAIAQKNIARVTPLLNASPQSRPDAPVMDWEIEEDSDGG
ncbi:MAG: cyclic nucleotide-binding domain-containing protein [Rhodospirillales bacterium]|nr:cyclic nucleotide-binding domain-containing protein [Rhodospirillales bacterium]